MRTSDRTPASRAVGQARAPARLFLTLAIFGLVSAACSAATSFRTYSPSVTPNTAARATASPTAGSTATATPSATPGIDVAAAFDAKMKSMLGASTLVSGALDTGALEVTIDGRYEFSGEDSHSTITATAGGKHNTREQVTRAGTTYVRSGDGPWYEMQGPQPGAHGFGAAVSATDLGVATINGRTLHRLAVSGSALDLAALGFGGRGPVSLTCYAEPDGTPVIARFDIDLTQGSGAAASKTTGTLELEFLPGAAPTIPEPEPIFVRFISKQGYAVSYPDAWDASAQEGLQVFEGPNLEMVVVEMQPSHGYTLSRLSSDATASIKRQLKSVKLLGNDAATLGGEKARLIYYTFKRDGADRNGAMVVAIHGRSAVLLSWTSPDGNEEADRATLAAMIDSFAFTT